MNLLCDTDGRSARPTQSSVIQTGLAQAGRTPTADNTLSTDHLGSTVPHVEQDVHTASLAV